MFRKTRWVTFLTLVLLLLFVSSFSVSAQGDSARHDQLLCQIAVESGLYNNVADCLNYLSGQDGEPIFSYYPGGPNYACPISGSVEHRGDNWYRIRSAANCVNPPWTFEFQLLTSEALDNVAQWDSPTRLILANNSGSRLLSFVLRIRRDHRAPTECRCDPYAQAGGNAPLGLGWFLFGNGATVTFAENPPLVLTGPGVKQVSFPRNYREILEFVLDIEPNGMVVINQGVRYTSTDSWPLPF